MSSPDFLIQATLKRLSARMDILLKDGPERLRQELQLFYEEVISEANRMKQEYPSEEVVKDAGSPIESDIEQSQEMIDRLRSKVADLNQKLELMS